jgi:ferric-dicitrate binding protein FerR (iron transport regulator)
MQHARLREAMEPADGDRAIARDGLVKLRRMKHRADARKKYIVFARYAAAVLLMVAVGTKFILRTPDSENTELAEAVAPAGKRMELQLPDGTKVWLAPRSRLVWPVEFSGTGRSVELSGGALFDVVPDAGNPFEVHSGEFSVKVLGTVFSTSSYNGEFETVLIEGAVEVSNDSGDAVTLEPGQRAWADEGGFETESVDTSDGLDLQRGIYTFDRATLGEITARLAVWHNVEIHISDPALAQQRFCAKFRDGDNIDTILKALQQTGGFEFSRDTSGAISIYRR